MTTIHAYTNDQKILDLAHEDLRGARGGDQPDPELDGRRARDWARDARPAGKVDGMSVRAPVLTGSIVDRVARVGREVTKDEVKTMANWNMVKVLGWYDNEWSYSCRLVDLTARVAETIPAAVA